MWGATTEGHRLGDNINHRGVFLTHLEIGVSRSRCQHSPTVRVCLLLQMADLLLYSPRGFLETLTPTPF